MVLDDPVGNRQSQAGAVVKKGACSAAHELVDPGVRNQVVKGRGGKNLTIQAQQQIVHVGPSLTKASTVNAGNHLVVRSALTDMLVSLCLQLFHPGHLVSGGAVVAGDLGLDDYYGI